MQSVSKNDFTNYTFCTCTDSVQSLKYHLSAELTNFHQTNAKADTIIRDSYAPISIFGSPTFITLKIHRCNQLMNLNLLSLEVTALEIPKCVA